MKVVRFDRADGEAFGFNCPGCGSDHVYPVGEGSGPRWWFNGSMDAPTFAPSMRIRTRRAGAPEIVCHAFVVNGRIDFVEDSTHKLAGQVVDLPEHGARPAKSIVSFPIPIDRATA